MSFSSTFFMEPYSSILCIEICFWFLLWHCSYNQLIFKTHGPLVTNNLDHLIHKKEVMIFFSYSMLMYNYTFACANEFTGLNSFSLVSNVAHEPPVLSPSMLHIIIALHKCGYWLDLFLRWAICPMGLLFSFSEFTMSDWKTLDAISAMPKVQQGPLEILSCSMSLQVSSLSVKFALKMADSLEFIRIYRAMKWLLAN